MTDETLNPDALAAAGFAALTINGMEVTEAVRTRCLIRAYLIGLRDLESMGHVTPGAAAREAILIEAGVETE